MRHLNVKSRLLPASVLLCVTCTGSGARPEDLRGTPYPDPLTKPEVTLTAVDGSVFDFRRDTEGFVTLLFFGYTYCPDVCPIHMANIASVLHTLTPDIAGRIKVVMVTTDPDRDTPERLGSWLRNFDSDFVGLRGTIDEVNAFQQELGLPPAVKYGEGDEYTVGHSSRVIAFTRDNRAHVSYPFGTRQRDWAHDLPLLVDRAWDTR